MPGHLAAVLAVPDSGQMTETANDTGRGDRPPEDASSSLTARVPPKDRLSRADGWRVAGGLFALVVLVYWGPGPQQSPFDFQLSQANNLIYGHLDMTAEYTRHLGLLERVLFDGTDFCLPADDPRSAEAAALIETLSFSANCLHYMQHSLGPAFLLAPLAMVWGLDVNQTLISVIIAGLTAVLVWAITRRFTASLTTQLGLTILAMFGTTIWFSGANGGVWHFAHMTAVLLLFATIYATVVLRSPLLAGAFVGAAFLCRPTTILAGFFPLVAFADMWFRCRHERWHCPMASPTTPILFALAIGVAPFIAVGMTVNWLRFGNPFDSGTASEQFHQINLMWRWEYGVLHPAYVPRHIAVIFEQIPILSSNGSFVWPSWGGLAAWITTPALVLGLFLHLKRFTALAIVAAVALTLGAGAIVASGVVEQLRLAEWSTANIPLALHLAPFGWSSVRPLLSRSGFAIDSPLRAGPRSFPSRHSTGCSRPRAGRNSAIATRSIHAVSHPARHPRRSPASMAACVVDRGQRPRQPVGRAMDPVRPGRAIRLDLGQLLAHPPGSRPRVCRPTLDMP